MITPNAFASSGRSLILLSESDGHAWAVEISCCAARGCATLRVVLWIDRVVVDCTNHERRVPRMAAFCCPYGFMSGELSVARFGALHAS